MTLRRIAMSQCSAHSHHSGEGVGTGTVPIPSVQKGPPITRPCTLSRPQLALRDAMTVARHSLERAGARLPAAQLNVVLDLPRPRIEIGDTRAAGLEHRNGA